MDILFGRFLCLAGVFGVIFHCAQGMRKTLRVSSTSGKASIRRSSFLWRCSAPHLFLIAEERHPLRPSISCTLQRSPYFSYSFHISLVTPAKVLVVLSRFSRPWR